MRALRMTRRLSNGFSGRGARTAPLEGATFGRACQGKRLSQAERSDATRGLEPLDRNIDLAADTKCGPATRSCGALDAQRSAPLGPATSARTKTGLAGNWPPPPTLVLENVERGRRERPSADN